MSRLIDMTGKKIGQLTVLGYAGSRFRGRASRASWHCLCDCGARLVVVGAPARWQLKKLRLRVAVHIGAGAPDRGEGQRAARWCEESEGLMSDAGAPGGHQAAVLKSRACPAIEVSG